MQPWFWQNALTTVQAALLNRLTACLRHCNCTCEDLLLIQGCSDAPPMHCSTGFGKMHSTPSSAALHNRLSPGLGHCNYTYQDLLLIQVCSDPSPMHCNPGFGKMLLPLSRLLCKTSSQHACVTAITPSKTYCCYRCAVTHH